jgi:hypothetical protein
MAMRSPAKPTLTYRTVHYSPAGRARPVAITLPYINCIPDDPRYRARRCQRRRSKATGAL